MFPEQGSHLITIYSFQGDANVLSSWSVFFFFIASSDFLRTLAMYCFLSSAHGLAFRFAHWKFEVRPIARRLQWKCPAFWISLMVNQQGQLSEQLLHSPRLTGHIHLCKNCTVEIYFFIWYNRFHCWDTCQTRNVNREDAAEATNPFSSKTTPTLSLSA